MPELNELKFDLIINPYLFAHIPPYLFKQVEGRSWSVERLYTFAPMFLTADTNRFWVLVNDEQVMKGVLWVVMDLLSEKLNVIVFSVDKEYQGPDILKSVLDFLRKFIKEFNEAKGGIKLKEKINWVTAQPEILEAIGGQRPKRIMIEI